MQTDPAEMEKMLRKLDRATPAADWVMEMIAHYQKHGYYRREDLDRLLGDPTRSFSTLDELTVEKLNAFRRQSS